MTSSHPSPHFLRKASSHLSPGCLLPSPQPFLLENHLLLLGIYAGEGIERRRGLRIRIADLLHIIALHWLTVRFRVRHLLFSCCRLAHVQFFSIPFDFEPKIGEHSPGHSMLEEIAAIHVRFLGIAIHIWPSECVEYL